MGSLLNIDVKINLGKFFFEKKAANSNIWAVENTQFLNGSHGCATHDNSLLKRDLGSSNITFFGLQSSISGSFRKWAFLKYQIWPILAVLRHFWLFKKVLSGHTGIGSF